MKSTCMSIAFAIAMSLAACTSKSASQDSVLVCGAISEKVVIVNRETKQIEWSYSAEDDRMKKSNSIVYLKGGNVLYAYEKGATMVKPNGDVVFEYKVADSEELQSVSQIKGGFLLGVCGKPMRIVEIDNKGRVKHEFSYNTGVQNKHRQFRQIAKTDKGTYVVPVLGKKKVVELDREGKLVKSIDLPYASLFVTIASDGDWLMTTGHDGYIFKIDSESGEIAYITEGKALDNGINIEFAAGIVELDNGNYLFANWLGHNGDLSQPFLIELDREGKVVWSMNRIEGEEGFTYAAGLSLVK